MRSQLKRKLVNTSHPQCSTERNRRYERVRSREGQCEKVQHLSDHKSTGRARIGMKLFLKDNGLDLPRLVKDDSSQIQVTQSISSRINKNNQYTSSHIIVIPYQDKKPLKHQMRYHLPPVKMAVIKKNLHINVGKNVEKRKFLCTVAGEVNWCSHCGKWCGDSTKN